MKNNSSYNGLMRVCDALSTRQLQTTITNHQLRHWLLLMEENRRRPKINIREHISHWTCPIIRIIFPSNSGSQSHSCKATIDLPYDFTRSIKHARISVFFKCTLKMIYLIEQATQREPISRGINVWRNTLSRGTPPTTCEYAGVQ